MQTKEILRNFLEKTKKIEFIGDEDVDLFKIIKAFVPELTAYRDYQLSHKKDISVTETENGNSTNTIISTPNTKIFIHIHEREGNDEDIEKKKAIKNEKESIKYIELGEHMIFKNNKKIHFNQFGNNLKLECRDVDEFMETSFMDLNSRILTGPLINSDRTIDDSIEMSDMNIFYNFRYTPEAIYAHVKTPANKERNILHERYILGLPLYFKFYICLKNYYRMISHSDPTVIIEILPRRKNLNF